MSAAPLSDWYARRMRGYQREELAEQRHVLAKPWRFGHISRRSADSRPEP